MKLKEILGKTTGFFREKGFPSARLDAELLLSHALGIERIRLYIDFERPVTEEEVNRCRELVRRRSQGEPVAYILGKKDFYNLTFEVGSGVLIPRPETEHLVEAALEFSKSVGDRELRVVDLGCGSGCVGITFVKNCPGAHLLAVDISPVALTYAVKNSEAILGTNDRCSLVQGDVSSEATRDHVLREAAFEGIDLLLANPPYIAVDDLRVENEVKKFEPSSALFAHDRGLADLKNWSRLWFPRLNPGGFVAMEMGLDQGEEMRNHFHEIGLEQIKIIKDLSGHDRIIQGVRHG